MRCDLHVHTHCSDGAHAPQVVIDRARKGGIDLLSLTDHDTIDAYDQLDAHPGLQLVPGVEITTHLPGTGELHILGYFPHGFTDGLRTDLTQIQQEREDRMREGVGRLARDAGLELTLEHVRTRCKGKVISRSHLAQTMVDRRIVPSYAEAFRLYIGSQHPYIPAPRISPKMAITLIRRSRGISVWAHPQLARLKRHLGGLVDAGLNGIEVYGRKSSGATLTTLESAATSFRLLKGGGSDWHGHSPTDQLGSFTVQAELIGQLLSLFKSSAQS